MSAISIVNAKKRYSTLEALKGINLDINKGEFFGLLGPNGAGKTTLICAIVGLCHLTEGSIAVCGFDVNKDFIKTHALLGYSPQDVNLDRFFTIKKILEFQAGFYGVVRNKRKEMVSKLLEQFKLTDKANEPYYKLSGGMQKRLLVAKALVGSPKVLILDEPTAGVDVEQRLELWEFLRGLNSDGTTIILTTHYIEEAEALCERIAIMNLGLVKEIGTPKELMQHHGAKKLEEVFLKVVSVKMKEVEA